MNESKQDRKRRLSRARSARYRKNKRDQVARVKGVKFKGVFGVGTMADLEHIRAECGCQNIEEAIALMVRFVAASVRLDPLAVRTAMNPRNPV